MKTYTLTKIDLSHLSDRSGNHPIRAICERRLGVTRMPKSEVEALFLAVNCFGCGQTPTDKLGGISLDKTGCRRKKKKPVSTKYNEPLEGFLEKEPSSG